MELTQHKSDAASAESEGLMGFRIKSLFTSEAAKKKIEKIMTA
jgi:hypothetical protein